MAGPIIGPYDHLHSQIGKQLNESHQIESDEILHIGKAPPRGERACKFVKGRSYQPDGG